MVVVGFNKPEFKGKVYEELVKVRKKGLIRLIDLLFVYKDSDGDITSMEMTDFSLSERVELGAVIGGLFGLGAAGIEGAKVGAEAGAFAVAENDFGLTSEEIAKVANLIPRDSAALLILFEHTWAIRLKEALLDAGAIPIMQGILDPVALVELGAEAAAVEEAAKRLEMA
jgi:uncharacterized membrane protein